MNRGCQREMRRRQTRGAGGTINGDLLGFLGWGSSGPASVRVLWSVVSVVWADWAAEVPVEVPASPSHQVTVNQERSGTSTAHTPKVPQAASSSFAGGTLGQGT